MVYSLDDMLYGHYLASDLSSFFSELEYIDGLCCKFILYDKVCDSFDYWLRNVRETQHLFWFFNRELLFVSIDLVDFLEGPAPAKKNLYNVFHNLLLECGLFLAGHNSDNYLIYVKNTVDA